MDKRLLCAENNFFKGLGVAATLALGLFVVTAFAPQAYGQATVSGGSFLNEPEITDIDQDGVLELFDSNLGTLTGVTITFTGHGTSDRSVTNNSQNPVTVQVTNTQHLFYTSDNEAINEILETISPVPDFDVDPTFLWQSALGVDFVDFVVGLSVGNTHTFDPIEMNASEIYELDSPEALAAFQAAGG